MDKQLPDIPASARPPGSLWERFRRFILGAPRDLRDRSIFHRLALIPILAWVGLGSDGLSSSAYGPEEAFRTLGEHTYLALAIVVAMAGTVAVISLAYSRIIEQFPTGGGGYVVASKLLGPKSGVVAGGALVIDYVLTITVSIAAAGDALFSFVPPEAHVFKLPVEIGLIAILTVLNIRGVRESILVLTPIFILFVITHTWLIIAGIGQHIPDLPVVTDNLRTGFENGLTTLGLGGMLMLLLHAYSLGGGTFTGIEAVSNGLAVMREPRVANGKRTMAYMAASLIFTACGLLLCYLLVELRHVPGKTYNAALVESLFGGSTMGGAFIIATLLAEGALLIVAAQTGFLGGPRVLASLALDWWLPRSFAALSDRLTTQNGIVLMGAGSLLALLYTKGDVRHLVVMYSINVFLTFSLSTLGMLRHWLGAKEEDPGKRRGRITLFSVGFVLCTTILAVTTFEKFDAGGWVTIVVTGTLVALCFLIHRHYRSVITEVGRLDMDLLDMPPEPMRAMPEPDPSKATAVILVSSYGGLGIRTTLGVHETFKGHFRNIVFLSVGVVDSDAFKGSGEMDALRRRTEEDLENYVSLAHGLGLSATYRVAIGTDAVDEIETLALSVAEEFPITTFFAGKLLFTREKWFHRLLHNETAYTVQRRLHTNGLILVVLPVRVS